MENNNSYEPSPEWKKYQQEQKGLLRQLLILSAGVLCGILVILTYNLGLHCGYEKGNAQSADYQLKYDLLAERSNFAAVIEAKKAYMRQRGDNASVTAE